jgi:uncharacterized protein
MAGTYMIKKSSDNKFYFNLVAENNEIVLTSETYNQKQNALDGVESVKKNSPDDGRYERKISADVKHYFVLTAANNQVIGTSEQYASKQSMEDGVAVVRKLGPKAEIKDQA